MRGLAILVLLCGPAAAQPVATSEGPEEAQVEPPEQRRSPHPPGGIGAGLVVGRSGGDGPSGWVARLDYELFPVFSPTRKLGGIFGYLAGIEVWRAGADNWGGSLPVTIVGGVRVFPIRAVIGLGFDAFLIDQIADDTGVGFWAPYGMARIGADLGGFQLAIDARAGHRWQLGAPDPTRWQVGVFFGRTLYRPES
jgi:hypothetical protein